MKSYLLIVLSLFSGTYVFSQSDTTKTDTTRTTSIVPTDPKSNQTFPFLNIIPPSPEAAGLGKYGDVPVSLSTGTTSIEIPITEIQSGTLKVPVKLSNHASAIKVNDIASSVGTGWSLLAGGAITRVVKGGVWDECSLGIMNQVIPEQTDVANFKCFIGNLNTNIDYVDGMPDDFYFNFNGLSGKFLFNTRSTSNQNISPIAVTYPHSNLKIEWVNQQNFVITDADGTVYKFDATESTVLTQSQSARNNPCGTIYTSAWYLSEIVSANRIDTIKFNYSTPAQMELPPIWSSTLTKKVNEFGNSSYSYQYAFQKSDPKITLVQDIVYNNGKVEFIYTNDRQDIADVDSKRLSRINIYKKDAAGSFSELRHFNLNQSYFNCNDGYSQIDNPQTPVFYHTGNPILKRLKLESVTEFSFDNISKPPYLLNYYEDYQLPIYASLAQDYWGNSNGAVNNLNLLLLNTDPTKTQEPSSTYGANCSFNFNYAVSGAIKKITYPTGGSTTIEYEPQMLNDGTKGGGIRVKKIKDSDSNNSFISQKAYNYIQPYFTNSAFLGDVTAETYVYTTNIWTDISQVGNCIGWTPLPTTIYPEKVSFTLGTAPTFIAYGEVEEYQQDSLSQRLGKINYTYSTSVDLSSADFPQELISTEWKRGLLLGKKTYSFLPNITEVKILEEQNTYQEIMMPYKTRGYVVRLSLDHDPYQASCPTSIPIYCNKYSSDNQYVFQEINLQSSVLLLSKTKKFIFDENGQNPVNDSIVFEYDSDKLLLTKTTTLNSDGKVYEELNKFPDDFSGYPIYDEMVNRHIYNPIIESEQKEDGISLKKSRTNYKHWYPTTSFGNVLGFFAPFSVESEENNSAWELEVVMGENLNNPTQNGYDLRARPIIYTLRNGAYTTLEWWDVLGKKDKLKKKNFQGFISEYDYEPEIGIKSITSPNALISTFEYDTFGRLKIAKDHNGDKLREYSYTYGLKNKISTLNYRVSSILFPSGSNENILLNQYFDGLGRPIQEIKATNSPLGFDIVTKTENYDKYERLISNILPTPSNQTSGEYISNILNTSKSFYSDNFPEDSISFEKSLLNRPKVTFGPGQAWRTADKKTQVFYESAGTDVRYYKVNAANSVILDGVYPANSLYKKRTIDEQGHTTIEITDKLGRLVQKQVQKDEVGGYMTTYYCYDGLGRVRAIIPPLAYDLNQSINATDANHNELIFAFEYDNRGRLIREDIPGAGERYSVYDKADRLVMQQDALQRETGKWNFTKYDAFDREVMRGETGTIGQTQSYWASLFASHSTPNEVWGSGGYSGTSFPSQVNAGAAEVRQYTFYDNYDFVSGLGLTDFQFDAINAYHSQYTNAKGLITGKVKYNLSDFNQYFVEATYYDNKNRPIQTFESHIGGTNATPNRTDFEYNFAGDVLKERVVLKKQYEASKTLVKTNTFDHAGRKTSFSLSINGQNEKVANYSYDEIGRLKTKHLYPDRLYAQADSILDYINRPPSPGQNTIDKAAKAIILHPGTLIDSTFNYLAHIDTLAFVGGTVNGIQKIDFGYHIRGLENCINCQSNVPHINTLENDFFASKLEWETAGRFDANIGKQTWKNKKDKATKSYVYGYDPSSRMTVANYFGNGNEDYSISNLSYDANGNILNLARKGFTGSNFGNIDQLSYTYTGNRLQKIDDAISGNLNTKDFRDSIATIDYSYWSNGNLKADLNKRISQIDYNTYLNKPQKITFLGGKELNFVYDGAGKLISRFITDSTKWVYTPSEIYKDDSLYQINQEEGRITRKSGRYKLEFEYRDLWGNLRTAFTDSDSLPISGVFPVPVISQINDYDPLGFEHFNNQEGTNNYRFQKQERVLDLDLAWDFWKLRPSDATIGSFIMPDPLSSQFPHNSVYAFQENKLGQGVELEGAELKEFGQWVGKKIDQALTFTDVDDVTVLVTTVSRGRNAVHVDGQTASTSDKWFAAGGLFLPAVSGGTVRRIFNAATNIKANQAAGAAREVAEHSDLLKKNPGASVQNQQYLRTADGKIAKDPVTGTGRRVDHVVIKDGKATDVVETTSQNANKLSQERKEGRIRETGGTYVRDRNTKELIDIKDISTRTSRRD